MATDSKKLKCYIVSLLMVIIGLSMLLCPDLWYTPKSEIDKQTFTKFAQIIFYCLIHKQLGLYILGFLLMFFGIFTANKTRRKINNIIKNKSAKFK
ncbi:MAG TPA: hypothetical protein QF753_16440 [Victivallales bacterium]|nr:hypothetical protein [Victivallales bacterium]|tara:strand:- start:174 stop:461 length:288 start_codon:yes stop_codon:yes gene_type:complete